MGIQNIRQGPLTPNERTLAEHHIKPSLRMRKDKPGTCLLFKARVPRMREDVSAFEITEDRL
jgi:hypothetical protein